MQLTNEQRAIAIWQIQGGHTVNQVAQHFGVKPKTIKRLCDKFSQTGHFKDRPRSGQPRVSIHRQDIFIRTYTLE